MTSRVAHTCSDRAARGAQRQSGARRDAAHLTRRAVAKLARLGVTAWRRITQYRNHVFACDGISACPTGPAGLTIARYAKYEAIPDHIVSDMARDRGPRSLDDLRWELDHNAVAWVASIDGRVVSSSMSRQGCHYTRWLTALRPQDLVIFRNATAPEFRGRGLCPALMQHVMLHELKPGGQVYVDCRVYNAPSIRSIEKAGFRWIATVKPVRRAEQLLPSSQTCRAGVR